MTNVTDDNLGRRLFQIQKEKAVEDALEKIRRGQGSDWTSIPVADRGILYTILGELWTSIDRSRWGSYSFSKLSKADIRALIAQAGQVKNKPIITEDDIRSLDLILSKTV